MSLPSAPVGSSSAALPARRDIRHYARQRAWCEWDEADQWLPRVLALLDDPDGATWPPFLLLSLPGLDAVRQRDGATRWTAQRLEASAGARSDARAELDAGRTRVPQERLRVGYLSGDFHQHATALLMIEMLEAHDRTRFELHAYSHGPDSDGEMRRRLTSVFTGFRDIRALDDGAAARLIHDDGIDILVDLKGYTEAVVATCAGAGELPGISGHAGCGAGRLPRQRSAGHTSVGRRTLQRGPGLSAPQLSAARASPGVAGVAHP
jgi:Glycosyl transferase family 41